MSVNVNGALVVDKPSGPTSHDIVVRVRQLAATKVGHMGTLDPLATGVLPLALGKATRLVRFYQGADKVYLADIRLGVATATFDREGPPTSKSEVPPLSRRQVEACLERFTGAIRQRAPIFSAVKVKGERLYRAARRGEKVDPPTRSIVIKRIRLLEHTTTRWRVEVECSTGTYIRALAHDLGRDVGCGAHLENLRRLRCGEFDLSEAVAVPSLAEEWSRRMIRLDSLRLPLPRLALESDQARRILSGGQFRLNSEHEEGEYQVFWGERLLGVARLREGSVRPTIVLRQPAELNSVSPFS